MLICVGCRSEMLCDKNSVGADFGNGHVYPADRYKCPVCGAMALKTNTTSVYDPDHRFHEEYLPMKEMNP